MPNPWNERGYKRYKRWLMSTYVQCSWPGCTERGTSPDHVPAVSQHHHVEGTGCCTLRPLCLHHNTSSGARLAQPRNRARPAREPHSASW